MCFNDVWWLHDVLISYSLCFHGPLARYLKSWIAPAPGMPGTFSPPPRVSDPDMHHGTCETHVPWNMPGSLSSGFLWSWWREKRSRHYRGIRNPQFYVSEKSPMDALDSSCVFQCCSPYASVRAKSTWSALRNWCTNKHVCIRWYIMWTDAVNCISRTTLYLRYTLMVYQWFNLMHSYLWCTPFCFK